MSSGYEETFAALFGPSYRAFAFWKGRVALYAILRALDLPEGEEVILPGYTCVVVASAVQHAGLRPVYADIRPGKFNLDPKAVAAAVTPRSRVLLIQHTYGLPADLEALLAIADRHGLIVVEDCAHAISGGQRREPLGSFGHAAFFSSQWSKPYTTGLGGIAITANATLARRLQVLQREFEQPALSRRLQLRLQYTLYSRLFSPALYWGSQRLLHTLSQRGLFVGSSSQAELQGERPYDLQWRMAGFQKRIGRQQLVRLAAMQQHRRKLAQLYLRELQRAGWPVTVAGEDEHVLLRLPVQVQAKERLLQQAQRQRFELGSWFETPLHPIPLDQHRDLAYTPGCCPVAEHAARTTINLPLHPRVSEAEAGRILEFVLGHAEPA